MLALLCVSSLALAAGHKLDGAKFGSKSSYFTVANQDTSSLEVISNYSLFMHIILIKNFLVLELCWVRALDDVDVCSTWHKVRSIINNQENCFLKNFSKLGTLAMN